MFKRFCMSVLAIAVLAAVAAPALADSSVCTVTSEIRVRKSPSKKAHVVAVLKKDTRVNATDKCAGGWVKIASEDGKIAGYVGGWALADASKTAKAPAEAAAPTEAAKPAVAAAAEPAAEQKTVPTNEQLAVQITEMRVRIVTLERSMKKINRDIRKIKTALSENGGKAKTARK